MLTDQDLTQKLSAMEVDLKDFIGRHQGKSKEVDARLLTIEQEIVGHRFVSGGSRSQEIVERALIDPSSGMPILGKSHKFADNLPHANHEQPRLDMNTLWRGILCNKWPSRDCAERKALSESSGSGGGYTLPLEVAATFIDFARANSVCIAAGAQTLPMDNATLRVPVLASDIICSWKAENADVAEVTPTLDKRDAVAHTLIGLLHMSIELAEDSPLISQIVTNAFAKSMGQQLDAAGLVGNDANGPTGLKFNPAAWRETRAVPWVNVRVLLPLRSQSGDFSQLWFFPRTNITIEVSREGGSAFTKAALKIPQQGFHGFRRFRITHLRQDASGGRFDQTVGWALHQGRDRWLRAAC